MVRLVCPYRASSCVGQGSTYSDNKLMVAALDTVLVVVWVLKRERGDFFAGVPEQPSVYKLRCRSVDGSVSFAFHTGNLVAEAKRKCELLVQHGFTVVRVERYLTVFANTDGNSQHFLIKAAADHMAALYPEGVPAMDGYDEDFGRKVLAFVASKHPARVNMAELKEGIQPEPTDTALVLALDALSIDGYIDGKGMRESTSGGNKLAVMAKIVSTKAGRDYLKPSSPATEQGGISNLHFHGPVGAVGHNSQGNVTVNQQWINAAPEPNWTEVAKAFGEAGKAKASVASSSEDFIEVAGLVKTHEQATQKAKSAFLETVSKIGQSALPILVRAGAHGLVGYLEHQLNWKLT